MSLATIKSLYKHTFILAPSSKIFVFSDGENMTLAAVHSLGTPTATVLHITINKKIESTGHNQGQCKLQRPSPSNLFTAKKLPLKAP